MNSSMRVFTALISLALGAMLIVGVPFGLIAGMVLAKEVGWAVGLGVGLIPVGCWLLLVLGDHYNLVTWEGSPE